MTAPILSVAQMRAAEQALFDAGVDPYALMCTAGEGAAELIWRVGGMREALVLCGPGNNGGDGFVIARTLRDLGVPVRVAALGESMTASSRQARADWAGPVEDVMTAEPAPQVIDALFGIGLTRGLASDLASRLGQLVDVAQYSYAIDVPSGVESDQAVALSPVAKFTHCVSLGAWKPAHVLLPAREFAEQYSLVDIGITPPPGCAQMMGRPHMRPPSVDAHKYTRGLVCVVAGVMPGAAALACEAAARSGAAYVRLVNAEGEGEAIGLSHAIVRTDRIDSERAKAVLVGPGLGRDDAAWERLVSALQSGVPSVVDADALWLLAERGHAELPRPGIVTPHEGEFVRLMPNGTGNKIERTLAAAAELGSVVIHKGPDTVIAAPDGRCTVAPRASSWLSTAGTGDVLAGLCAGRLAVTGDPFTAACESVWLHGQASRRAGAAFIADDLISCIPAVLGSAL
jgi:hydroxyethylthiazole kinase-like uncharacterized protein yjeF